MKFKKTKNKAPKSKFEKLITTKQITEQMTGAKVTKDMLLEIAKRKKMKLTEKEMLKIDKYYEVREE